MTSRWAALKATLALARHQLGATPAQLGKGNGVKVQMSRWKGMDEDISDDQQDIARGRGMVDSKFQGGFGLGGTQVRPASPPPARDRTRRISRKSAFVAVPATDFSPNPERTEPSAIAAIERAASRPSLDRGRERREPANSRAARPAPPDAR